MAKKVNLMAYSCVVQSTLRDGCSCIHGKPKVKLTISLFSSFFNYAPDKCNAAAKRIKNCSFHECFVRVEWNKQKVKYYFPFLWNIPGTFNSGTMRRVLLRPTFRSTIWYLNRWLENQTPLPRFRQSELDFPSSFRKRRNQPPTCYESSLKNRSASKLNVLRMYTVELVKANAGIWPNT